MKQKLILLNGFAGVGKSTIAQKYISETPLTLCLEGDLVMGMIGCWREHELDARNLKLSLISNMLETHLNNGQSVILPYLVTDVRHVEIFEDIAKKCNVDFIETFLFSQKAESTQYLLERGRWGEEGSKLLTEVDVPRIHSLYELMFAESSRRVDMRKVEITRGDVEQTYQNFLNVVI